MKIKSTFFRKTLLILTLLLAVTTQVWAAYEGVGVFTKVTNAADLTDGYYVVATATNFAMSSAHDGTMLPKIDIAPSGQTVINPSTAIVWKIENSGSDKTIYSEETSKYVSYTGASNNIQVTTTATSNNQKWTFSYAANLWTITNVAVSARMLQYNASSPRFACYTSEQTKIVLYKLEVTPTTPTITTPATPLDFSKELGAVEPVTKELAITGVNLTANITAALSGENADMFTLSKSEIDMAGETISITYSPTAVGSHTATLSLSSTDATPIVISLSGQCTAPALGVPTITDATQVANDGFAANWTAASQAESYELDVYTYQGGTGLTTIVSEDFNKLVTAAGGTIDFAKETALVGWAGETVANGNTNPSTHASNMIASNLKLSTGNNNGWFSLPCALSSDATLSFDLKNWTNTAGTAGDAAASLKISHAADGSSFVTLATIDLTTLDPIVFVPQQIAVAGGTASSVLKFEATKRMFLDNLVITAGAAATKVSVDGYPMNVADVTTYRVGGLSPQTTYYYTVAAIRGQEKRVSAEASVTTDLPSGISSTESISTIYTSGGAIHLSATAGEMIEVYNQMGQRLYSGVAVDGLNQLTLSARGVLLVKAGTKVAKVVL